MSERLLILVCSDLGQRNLDDLLMVLVAVGRLSRLLARSAFDGLLLTIQDRVGLDSGGFGAVMRRNTKNQI